MAEKRPREDDAETKSGGVEKKERVSATTSSSTSSSSSSSSSSSYTYRLRLNHCAQLVRVASHGERVKTGKAMDDGNIDPKTVARFVLWLPFPAFHVPTSHHSAVEVVNDGTLVVGHDGKIVFAGPASEVEKQLPAGATFERDMDCTGKAVIPGFCDAHTHPVWSGDRVHEFKMKVSACEAALM